MKKFLITILCFCLISCVFAACGGEQTELYVDGTDETTLATQTESEEQSDNESEEESEPQDPEQTMGAIQEMIPKTG